MAKLNFDGAEIGIPCPQCGQQTKGTIGSFKRQGHFTCRGCSSNVVVDMRELDQQVRELERSLSKKF